MIAALLNHHAERLRRDPNAKVNALMHCHVYGVVSIMLHDAGHGNRMRLFVALEGHQLGMNVFPLSEKMNLAIHPHHCDITLVRVFGHIVSNHFVARSAFEAPDGAFHKCRYDSAINGGCGGLIDTGEMVHLDRVRGTHLTTQGEHMKADQLHSIYVPPRSVVAWLVMEGAEDPNYEPFCYTLNPQFDPRGMYTPMDREAVIHTLRSVARHSEI